MNESTDYLNCMINIPCLDKRIKTWQPMVEQASNHDVNHPVIHAFQANILFRQIIDPTFSTLQFNGENFNFSLLLDLFQKDYLRQKIDPNQVSKNIHALYLLGYFKLDVAENLKRSVLAMQKSSDGLNDHSIFNQCRKSYGRTFENGRALEYASEALKDDEEIVFTAVNSK